MDRNEWLAERRKAIGSSDAAAVCGLAPPTWDLATPLHVWADKMGLLPDRDSKEKKSGRMLEDVVAQMYEEQTGNVTVKPDGADRHSLYPWLAANLDRVVVGQGRSLECKTARFADGWGEPNTNQIPAHYMCQVQHQMLVTGFEVADVAVLIGGQDLVVYTVERNPEFHERLLAVYAELWGYVERKEEPPADWSHPATVGLMDVIRKPVPGKVVELGEDAAICAAGYMMVCDEIREKEKAKERFKLKLLEIAGDAERGVCSNGLEVIRKSVSRKGYEVKASEYITLTVKPPKQAAVIRERGSGA